MSHKIMAIFLTATALAGTAHVATAQTVTGGLTLGYGNTNIGGVDENLSVLSFDAMIDADFGNGLTVGGAASFNNIKIDDLDESLSASAFGIDGSYRLQNGFRFGAYLERATLKVNDLDLDFDFDVDTGVSATSYGLSGGFAANALDLEVFFGATTTDPDLADNVDIRDLGLVVGYDIADSGHVGASVVRTRISAEGEDADLTTMGFAGSYNVDPSFTLFGGVARSTLDLVDADLTTFGIGASYDLNQIAGFSSSVSLELARSTIDLDGDNADLDTVRFGLTIPLGGTGPTVPLNSVASGVLKPRHSALSSAVLSTF